MKFKELAIKSEKELHAMLVSLREQLRKANFDLQEKEAKNVRGIRNIRKQIAHVMTQMNGAKKQASEVKKDKKV